jgi:SpoVK/Ycf46/Vps4 family AAA+-type ATPase
VLFQDMNEIDGMEEDADVFLLTTNRADRVEPAADRLEPAADRLEPAARRPPPAAAARPGRVDLATEIPLPAEEARGRLIELYGRDFDLRPDDVGRVVERTRGVTASFFKEFLRKAALASALGSDGDGRIAVSYADGQAALDELLAEETTLTRRLLGARRLPPRHDQVPSGCQASPRSS